ncbi:hypothetical protein H4Q26_016582, partial [Puccinia striiformis f. sp. tritici PST-130]
MSQFYFTYLRQRQRKDLFPHPSTNTVTHPTSCLFPQKTSGLKRRVALLILQESILNWWADDNIDPSLSGFASGV